MQCEKCGSRRVQPAPVVYRTGRKHIGPGLRHALLATPASPAYAPACRAARLAAPPRMRSQRYPVIGLLSVAAMLALSPRFGWISAALGGLTLVGTLAGLAANSVYNRHTYPATYRHWQNTCLCLDCGGTSEQRD